MTNMGIVEEISSMGSVFLQNLASYKSVSMCQCVSLPQRPIGSVQVRQEQLWNYVAKWRVPSHLISNFLQI